MLNDLIHFPQKSEFRFFGDIDSQEFSYVHWSGHPANQAVRATVMRGDPGKITRLIQEVKPATPFVIRETPWDLCEAVRSSFPEASVYREVQMTVDARSVRLMQTPDARVLTPEDVDSLSSFTGSPASGRARLLAWLNGTTVVGVFVDGALAAIGSTLFSLPEVSQLVSIRTKSEYRERGYGSQVVSKLSELALLTSEEATLTVLAENNMAIGIYRKHGYVRREERLWASIGRDIAPS